MELKINHLQHIGIPVTDIKRSAEFYEGFGFRNVMDTEFNFNGGKGNAMMMKLNEMIIELYQMPEKELLEIRNRSNGHIDHIAFDVDDIEEYFNIAVPDGERLEFNQIL